MPSMSDCSTSFSICIPCYDDLRGLRATLKSLVECLESKQKDQFHIVIGLNDCNFEKKDILKGQSLNPGIVISCYKTQKYLEYDDSILFVLSKVRSDFCLLIGCGDLALPNLSKALFSFGNSESEFGLLPVRVEREGKRLTNLVSEDTWRPTSLGVFNKVLSGHIFRTSSLNFLFERPPFLACEWAHVEIAIVVQGQKGNGSLKYDSPAILRYISESGWWTKVDIYKQYIEYCDLLLSYNDNYPNLAYVKEELNKAYSVRLLLMILQVRANGLREIPLFFSDWVRYCCNGRAHHFVMKLALRTPANLAAGLMKLANWWLQRKN